MFGVFAPSVKEKTLEATPRGDHLGVLTETHHLEKEAKALSIPGYEVSEGGGRYTRKGGVLISVALGAWGRDMFEERLL